MKNFFLGFVATLAITASFAKTPIVENGLYDVAKNKTSIENKNKLKKTQSPKNKDVTVTCSVTVGGVTTTATAGNWFSTRAGATDRCLDKLMPAE
jgi:hypothetical protein